VPAATPVLLNMSTIAAVWWLAPWFSQSTIEPIFAMAVGVMVGGVLQLGLQIPALHRLGLLPRIGLSWSVIRTAWADPATKNITHLMAPALLGVSVAQISLLINTQIASHLATGSVSWLSYADRLMEFPTAMLGVALGVVLMPQLAAANASGNSKDYSALLDWGLRIVVLLAVPCAVALLLFSQPLVAVLFHYKAFTAFDVAQTALALQGWGVGLVGIVAIKVLAPGYYARQDIKTPVRIAIAVLVITQLLNWALVPFFKHAALSLSIGLGAVINAVWLLVGLRIQKTYQPEPGWLRFSLQVILGAVVLAVFLGWAAQAFPWLDMPGKPLQRIGGVAAVILGSGALYLGTVSLLGLNLRQFLRR
jgi:putative peptidoglycan lipid II flippase